MLELLKKLKFAPDVIIKAKELMLSVMTIILVVLAIFLVYVIYQKLKTMRPKWLGLSRYLGDDVFEDYRYVMSRALIAISDPPQCMEKTRSPKIVAKSSDVPILIQSFNRNIALRGISGEMPFDYLRKYTMKKKDPTTISNDMNIVLSISRSKIVSDITKESFFFRNIEELASLITSKYIPMYEQQVLTNYLDVNPPDLRKPENKDNIEENIIVSQPLYVLGPYSSYLHQYFNRDLLKSLFGEKKSLPGIDTKNPIYMRELEGIFGELWRGINSVIGLNVEEIRKIIERVEVWRVSGVLKDNDLTEVEVYVDNLIRFCNCFNVDFKKLDSGKVIWNFEPEKKTTGEVVTEVDAEDGEDIDIIPDPPKRRRRPDEEMGDFFTEGAFTLEKIAYSDFSGEPIFKQEVREKLLGFYKNVLIKHIYQVDTDAREMIDVAMGMQVYYFYDEEDDGKEYYKETVEKIGAYYQAFINIYLYQKLYFQELLLVNPHRAKRTPRELFDDWHTYFLEMMKYFVCQLKVYIQYINLGSFLDTRADELNKIQRNISMFLVDPHNFLPPDLAGKFKYIPKNL